MQWRCAGCRLSDEGEEEARLRLCAQMKGEGGVKKARAQAQAHEKQRTCEPAKAMQERGR